MEVQNLHKTGWKGLWYILVIRHTFGKFPFIASIISTIILMAFLIAKTFDKSFDILKNTSELVLSFFPNLLGFTLGGFAIIVGFSNADLIKEGASLNKPSVYQILNVIFSYCIITQLIVTTICFIIDWSIKIDASQIVNFTNDNLCNCINFILLFFVIFGSLFTLLLIPIIIINLFTFSQVNSLYYTLKEMPRLLKEKEDDEKEKEEKRKDEELKKAGSQ